MVNDSSTPLTWLASAVIRTRRQKTAGTVLGARVSHRPRGLYHIIRGPNLAVPRPEHLRVVFS
jgi:hypothetical protein